MQAHWRAAWPLRLGGELQPAGLLQGFDIEGPQFGRTVDVDQHRDAAGGSRRRNHPRALRQGDDAVDADGPGVIENAVADHADDGGDCDQGGEGGYDHHQPRPRHQGFGIGDGRVTGYGIIRYLGHEITWVMAETVTQKSIVVAAAEAGERLDRMLARHVAELSRSRLKALIEAGAVALDGHTIRDANHRVNSGTLITVDVPPPEPA